VQFSRKIVPKTYGVTRRRFNTTKASPVIKTAELGPGIAAAIRKP
jgi:hypothetical protein